MTVLIIIVIIVIIDVFICHLNCFVVISLFSILLLCFVVQKSHPMNDTGRFYQTVKSTITNLSQTNKSES